ncbi:unnamed protein product [Caenorhabditis bovis]|uniref:protein-tyrosine-phosphatase n=1 Tax=Caenorhabditis bovis TaxID=2654633 RepID=A0A8S1F316_9PELO|nr:unnamed protein product [Caenorhabditis bovis]
MQRTETCLRAFNFYYRVSGEKAEQLLEDYGENGDFLVRYSESSPSNFSLTIRIDDKPLHIKVQKVNEMLSVFPGGADGTDMFGSLVELLEYYIENPTKLKERNGGFVAIKKPVYIPYELEDCAKEQRIVQLNRWFHANMTAQESMVILDREKTGSFLLRCSQHLPGALVISSKVETGVVHLNIHQDPFTGRYTIDGDHTEYCDIRQLLSTYNKNPIVEKALSSRVVYLENAVTSSSTFVPADVLADRLELLKQSLEPGNTERTGISEEFARLQAEQGPAEQYFSKREGRREINVDKNRYRNIVPFDHSRVILTDRAGVPGGDYINASYVKFDKPNPPLTLIKTRSYIATQGCLESTIGDFWRMIWQENSRVIVMPTRENERREKCTRYWPELNDSATFADIVVTTTEEKLIRKELPDEFKGHVKEPEPDEISFIIRTFNVKKNGAPAPRIVRQLQYVSWPDHGCPFHPHDVICYLDAVDQAHKQFDKADVKQGPVVVHCSAGIGRTGTLLILDVLLTQIKLRGRGCPIDIWRTSRHARDYRGGLVQTEQQYQFLYTAIAYYMKRTNPNDEQRLVLRERHSSSLLPLAPSHNNSVCRMPDVAQAYIGPSTTNNNSLSPRMGTVTRTRSRHSPKSAITPPLPQKTK